MTWRILSLASLVLAHTVGAAAQVPPPPVAADRLPVVVMQGDAVIRRAPDRAFVSIAVESRAAKPRDAQQQNAQVMAAVQEKLRAAGVPKENVQTTAYDLELEFDYAGGKRTPRGYLARNSIEVRVDDLARVGEIIDLAVGAGATNVSGVRFDLKERAAVEREAVKAAVADALARAEAAAAGAGRSIDRVQRIEEQAGVRMPQPRPMALARAAAPGPAETPIAPTEIEIRAQVTLTAVLK